MVLELGTNWKDFKANCRECVHCFKDYWQKYRLLVRDRKRMENLLLEIEGVWVLLKIAIEYLTE